MSRADQLFYRSLRELIQSGYGQDGLRSPYSQNPWVYRAVRSHVTNINAVPMQLRRGTDKEFDVIDEHPLVSLLMRPNPNVGGEELIERTITGLDTQGEYFWVKESLTEEGYRPGQVPAELWPVDPRYMTEILNDERTMVLGWRYDYGATPLYFDAEQVVHFRFYDPENPWRGLPPLSPAMPDAESDYLAAVYNRNFFKNGARLSGVLSTDEALNEEQRQRELKAFRDTYSGASRAHRVALLGSGVKYQESRSSHKDMEWGEGRRYTREVVGAVFGTPKFELGVYEDINYSTLREGKRWYWENTLIPFMGFLTGVINGPGLLGLVAEAESRGFYFAYDLTTIKALQDPIDDRITAAEKLMMKMGVPLEQVNEMFDLGIDTSKIPHASRSFLPVALVEVGDDGELKTEPPEPVDEPAPDPDPPEEEDDAKEIVIPRKGAPPLVVARVHGTVEKVSDDRRRTIYAMLAADAQASEKAWKAKLRRWFFKTRKNVMRAFDTLVAEREEALAPAAAGFSAVVPDTWPPVQKNAPLTAEDAEALLVARTAWQKELEKFARPLYTQTIEMTTATTATELGGGFISFAGAHDAELVEFVASRTPVLAEGVTSTLSRQVRTALLEGLAENESVQGLRKRLVDTFNMASKRGATIARTETGIAQNATRYAAFQREKIARHVWTTARDTFVRDDPAGNSPTTANHVVLEGESVKVGDPFPNGLRFPMEPGAPAVQIINCRCATVADFETT